MSQTAPALPAAAGFRGRSLERALLFWNLPLFVLAAWGVATAQKSPAVAFVPALTALGIIWGGCMALHLVLSFTGFDGDLLILPLTSLLLLIGGTYHLDLAGPATPGITPGAYSTSAISALVILGVVTGGGRWFRRLNLLIEEKVWWRIAKDRPYYESIPFHLLLLAMMGVLALLLLVGGVRSQGGSLIQVRLPGGFSFTPSELIRLAVAFFLADYLGRNARIMRSLRQPLGRAWPLNRLYFERRTELLIVLTTVGLYCVFFYAFRDFGPAAVIIALALVSLYAATGRALTPTLLGLFILALVGIPTWKNLAFHTFRDRLGMWLDPWNTHFVNGDHSARILWAISAGGWFGMGVGTQNMPVALPLARNDCAFAGVSATMGFWTALALLGIFAAITWRGMQAARQAPTDRMRLLGFCLTTLLAFQAIWICGAMVRVFPFTGINLPFVSTGLTSVLASALALGTVWNISRSRSAQPDSTEATPELLRGIDRLAKPITWAFALPAIGIVLYGCPWLLGDATLNQSAVSLGRARERTTFTDPYLDRFRERFPRGRIFSADGKLLAVSDPNGVELQEMQQVSPTLAEEARAHPKAGQRYYPLRQYGAQLVGWTPQGRFSALKGSVETGWDDLLRGYDPGKLTYYFRTRNNPLVKPPQRQDLQLTIDSELQRYTSKELSDAVQAWGGAGGAAVFYDAVTGEVLCAATAPSFDPNGLTLERMQNYVAANPRTQVLVNKALARDALYYPGSCFKILTAATGLEHSVTGDITCVNGHNAEPITWEWENTRWKRNPGRIRDYGSGGHGPLRIPDSLDRAMSGSCNVFFAKLATEIGPDHFYQAIKNAELQDLPKSPRALAEHLDAAGFGQIAMKASPFEMARLAGAFARARQDLGDDAGARPHWVKAIVTQDQAAKNNNDSLASTREPDDHLFGAPNRSGYHPFSASAAARVRELMVGVVQNPGGTAHDAFYSGGSPRLQGITVGGKTGTAEFEKTAGGRKTIGRHAWFVGFARSDHELQPRTVAFAVLLEDVRRGATGGGACAPLARRIIERILPQPGGTSALRAGELSPYYHGQAPTPGPLGPAVDWFKHLFKH